jgi:hypothetical protein
MLLAPACAREPAQMGQSVPVKIQFEFAATALSAASIESGSSAGASDSGSSAGTSETATGELNRILIHPEKLVSEGLTQFKVKRVFRWLSFRINRGTQVLKSGSVELSDPKLLDISPIEIDALTGDSLSVSVSLFQVDFMNQSDGDALCRSGAPGFVRTWSGTTNSIVDQSGVMSVRLDSAGQTTVHMAAVGFNPSELSNMNVADFRHVLTDRLTGQTFEGELCRIYELPATDTPAGLRFLKMMTFSQPLKTHMLGVFTPQYKTAIIPSGTTEAWSSEGDKRAAVELGITLAGKSSVSADGTRSIMRILPSALLGNSWQPVRPEISIGPPSTTRVNGTGRVEYPLTMNSNTRFNFDNSKIIQPVSGPKCSARFIRGADQNQGSVVLEGCQGDGAWKLKLDEGAVVVDSGTKSILTESAEIIVDNTAPSLSIISPPLESFVGGMFNINGFCEGGASKVSLYASGLPVHQSDCTEYIPDVYQFLFVMNTSGMNGPMDFKIVQADSAGNQSSVPLRVIVDTLAPTVTVNQSVINPGFPPNTTTMRSAGSVVYGFSAVDSPQSSGGPFWDLNLISLVETGTSGCSKTVDTSGNTITVTGCTGNGTVSLSLPAGVARDGVSNASVAAGSVGTVVVDNLGPALVVTSPAATQWVNNSFALNASCEAGGSAVSISTSSYLSAANSSVTCTAGGTFSTTVHILSGAPDGSSHSVTLSQNDSVGNASALTRTINLDRTLPTISVTPSGPITTNISAKTFTFSGSDFGGSGTPTVDVSGINLSVTAGISGCSIVRDNTAKTVTVSGCTGDVNAGVAINIPAGAVRDAAGNDSVGYPNFISLNIDNTAPAPTLGPIGTPNVASTTVNQSLNGSCSTPDGIVTLIGDVVSQTATCSSNSYSFSSFQLTSGAGTKNIRVRQTDAAGNVGESSSQMMTLVALTPPSISSTLDFSSMGMRPYFSGTCDSATGNTTTLTSSVGRAAHLSCVSGYLFGMLSLPFSSSTNGTITLTTTTSAGASVSVSYTFTKNSITTCPFGFVKVSGLSTHISQLGNTYATHGNPRAWLDTGQDFCVMKFQAKESAATAGTIGLNYYSNAPWINISRDQAMNKCRAMCTSALCNNAMTMTGAGSFEQSEIRGYRLISNTQWQVIARNIVQQTSNWTLGAVGSGTLYQGHTDAGPANPVQNGSDNATEPTDSSGAFFGIGESSGPQRRVHYLTGTEYLFDFSGNAWQWVSDDRSGGTYSVGLSNTLSTAGWFELTSFSGGNFQSIFGYEITYNSSQLAGRISVPPTLGTAIVRGGFYGAGSSNLNFGIFATDFSRAPATAYPDVGFRCVYVP